MIVVQAALQMSRNTSCKTEKEIEQNAKHELYIRNKHNMLAAYAKCSRGRWASRHFKMRGIYLCLFQFFHADVIVCHH